MRRILRLATVFAISTMLLNAIVLTASGDAANQSGQSLSTTPDILIEARIVSVNIRRVAQILKREGIPLEAGLFFTAAGREKLRPQLTPFPDMVESKVASAQLRGVVMADSITFPETSQLEADTLIIANQVIFTGRGPTIKGAHDLHLFALDSIKFENGPETVITIDLNGSRGNDGTDGTAGLDGENGGAGKDGDNGTDAGNLTIAFGQFNGGTVNVTAIGGNGGDGGTGGPGGNGHGPEARGGTGGMGGQGGKGGKGSTIVISAPSSYKVNGMKIVGHSGGGGRGGRGGPGGVPGGRGGEPGKPGEPGEVGGGVAQTIAGRDGKNVSRLEPGITNEKCTEWLLKNTYVGCF